MTAIPQVVPATVRAIYAKYEERRAEQPQRGYLGASIIGHACDRYLWLSFRWAGAEAFEGRMLRLFDQGHRAEPRFVDELRMIGVTVHETGPDGEQFAVQACDGHFRGHLDGAVLGLPEAPKTWHVAEFKTHNAKSFKALHTAGVREAKPMHWAQMQVYMLLTGMTRALYLAENKDTAELYEERVVLDKPEAERLVERARRIIAAVEPPPRLSTDPAWFTCKYCLFHAQCHATAVPEPTCRSCTHATPAAEGLWSCAKRGSSDIPLGVQQTGCAEHRFIPILLERIGKPVDVTPSGNVVYQVADGSKFTNGTPPAGFSSREIHACEDKRFLTASAGMPDVQQWREKYDAKVVG